MDHTQEYGHNQKASPLTYGQQGAGTSFNDSTGQSMDNAH